MSGFVHFTSNGRSVAWLGTLIVAMGFACSPVLCVADEFDVIDEREREYEKALEDGRQLVLKAFAAEILKANKENRSNDITRLTNHLKVFRSSGIMASEELHPQFIEYGTTTHAARDRLWNAYEDATKKCVEELRFEKAEELRATIKARGLDSRLVSIRLAKRHTDFIVHGNYLGHLAPIKNKMEKVNSTFEMVTGLSDPKGVSFKSINVPDNYLVHGDNRIRLQKFNDVEGFRQNATFLRYKGLGQVSAVMFGAANIPTHSIRAKGRELWIEPIQQTATFSDRAEFEIVEPQVAFWGKKTLANKK